MKTHDKHHTRTDAGTVFTGTGKGMTKYTWGLPVSCLKHHVEFWCEFHSMLLHPMPGKSTVEGGGQCGRLTAAAANFASSPALWCHYPGSEWQQRGLMIMVDDLEIQEVQNDMALIGLQAPWPPLFVSSTMAQWSTSLMRWIAMSCDALWQIVHESRCVHIAFRSVVSSHHVATCPYVWNHHNSLYHQCFLPWRKLCHPVVCDECAYALLFVMEFKGRHLSHHGQFLGGRGGLDDIFKFSITYSTCFSSLS